MPLSMMPYIEFATENYINAKYNLAKSDVKGPKLESIIDTSEVFHLLKSDSYSLMKKFRSKISKHYDVPPGNIEFTIGVTNSFFTLSHIMKNLGHKRVLCESPGYEPFWLTPEGCGLEVFFFERNKEDYTIDLDKLEQSARQGDWFWISNPHNPSGKYLKPSEIKEIAEVLRRKKAFLFVDEIYHDFVTPLGVDSALKQSSNIVISSSFTKAYGLGGLKVGWIIGPELIIKQAMITRLHQFMLMPSSSLSFLIPFLEVAESVRMSNVQKIKKNSKIFREKLFNTNLNSEFPEFGPISLYKLEKGIDDIKVARDFSQNHGIVIAPGSFFRSPGELRLSCAGESTEVYESSELLLHLLES